MGANINDRNFGQNLGDGTTQQSCAAWEPLLILFAAGEELEPAEQSRVSAHLTQCSECSAALDREKQLISMLAIEHADPDAALLAGCRAGFRTRSIAAKKADGCAARSPDCFLRAGLRPAHPGARRCFC